MKTSRKVISFLSLGIASLTAIGLLTAEVKAESKTYLALGPTVDTARMNTTQAQNQATDLSPPDDTTVSASPTPGGHGGGQNVHKKTREIYNLGICVGQTLAKQGIYLSDINAGTAQGNADDVANATKNARQNCEQAQKGNPTPTVTATPTESPAASPSASPATSPSTSPTVSPSTTPEQSASPGENASPSATESPWPKSTTPGSGVTPEPSVTQTQ